MYRELDLLVALAGVQAIEIGNAVNAEHDGLAIDHELIMAIPQRAFDDPRIAAAPVVTVPGEEGRGNRCLAWAEDRHLALRLRIGRTSALAPLSFQEPTVLA